MNTVKDELFPVLNDLNQLMLEIHSLRIVFPLYSSELKKYDSKYQDIAGKFFTIVQKLETPDILFEGLPENPQDIASYFQLEAAFRKNIARGSRYIELLDRILDRKRQTIFNSWTLLLGAIAILVGLFSTQF